VVNLHFCSNERWYDYLDNTPVYSTTRNVIIPQVSENHNITDGMK